MQVLQRGGQILRLHLVAVACTADCAGKAALLAWSTYFSSANMLSPGLESLSIIEALRVIGNLNEVHRETHGVRILN